MKQHTKKFTLAELTQSLALTIRGDANVMITGVSPIQSATSGHITFLTNSTYRKFLAETKASAVILSEADAKDCKVTAVISGNPYYTYAKMAEYFLDLPVVKAGVHPSVVTGQHCEIDPAAHIAAHCVLGTGVRIGSNVVLGAGCSIGDGVTIDADTQLDANVTIYHGVTIGKRVRIASGAVIGSDGFGFANNKTSWHKVPQLGSVVLGDDVDIGANTAIDRGAIEDTIIEKGVKLDNLIQIGHNVRIGEHTVIAGCVAIAGSTTIGKNCMIGGAACFAGHITIADQVMITGITAVTKSITEPGIYSSGIVGAVPNQEFRKNNARFHRLSQLTDRVKALESTIKSLVESKTP